MPGLVLYLYMGAVRMPPLHVLQGVKLRDKKPPRSAGNRPAIGFTKTRLRDGVRQEFLVPLAIGGELFRAGAEAAFENVERRLRMRSHVFVLPLDYAFALGRADTASCQRARCR